MVNKQLSLLQEKDAGAYMKGAELGSEDSEAVENGDLRRYADACGNFVQ